MQVYIQKAELCNCQKILPSLLKTRLFASVSLGLSRIQFVKQSLSNHHQEFSFEKSKAMNRDTLVVSCRLKLIIEWDATSCTTLSGVCCNIFVPPKRIWFLSRLEDKRSSGPLPVIETCKEYICLSSHISSLLLKLKMLKI